jgi:hypothetical protein
VQPPAPDEPSALATVVGLVMAALRRLGVALLVLAVLVGVVGLADTLLLADVAPWWLALVVGLLFALFVIGLLRYRAQLRSVVARQDRLVELLDGAGETAGEVAEVLERAEAELDGAGPLKRLGAMRRIWRELTAIPEVDDALELHEDVTDPSLRLVWWSLPVLAVALVALPLLAIAAIFL